MTKRDDSKKHPHHHTHHSHTHHEVVKEKVIVKKSRSLFALLPVIPHLFIIAIGLGLYYAMVNFYLFFNWGFFIYWGIKALIGLTILAASFRSMLIPCGSLLIGLLSLLFIDNVYVHNVIASDTAWQLIVVGLVGMLITVLARRKL